MRGMLLGLFGGALFFAATPSSSNYNLQSYDVGNSGGTDSSSSTNYEVNATAGEQTGDAASSTNFTLKSGENPTQDASVVPKPTLSNPSNYYDRLNLVIDQGSNPSDTLYLIAISSDGFTTTRYVQTDNSIGASYTIANYQSYAAWGSGSGFTVTGLTQGTTYTVKVRALQGAFTESAYSPVSDPVATVTPTLSFGVSTTLAGSPPFLVGFSSLAPNTVFAGDADGTISMTTNAKNGGTVYIRSLNGGLVSARASYTLSSATADLTAVATGYGAQITSATQSSGGPISAQSPFGGSGNNVGVLTLGLQPLLSSANPVSGVAATLRFKAKADFVVPAETDYQDTVTLLAAMNY